MDDYGTTDAMIKILLDKFQISSLILHGSLLHMRCAAYIFNLIAQDSLAVIGESIDKIRESVLFWTTSKKRNKKFEEAARQLHISSTKELILDSKTRWNSTHLMLSTALVYKDVFLHFRQCDSSYNCIPSEINWEIVKDICGTLELFYDMTKFVSGTTYPKASMYFHYMCQVKMELSECIISSNELIRKMASNMLEKFDSYWNVVGRIMGVAAVLDPRFKMKLLEWSFPTIYSNTAYEEIEKIRRIFYDLLEQYHSKEMNKEDSFANSSFCMTKGSQSKSLMSLICLLAVK